VKHRIQRIVLKLTADILRAVEDDGEELFKKSVELHKQIAGEGLPRELGILAKLIELTVLMMYHGCLEAGIAGDYPRHEFCRSFAISTISTISRIAELLTLDHLEEFQSMNPRI